jgi:hypothetical protein
MTTIDMTNPHAREYLQVCTVKAHLKLVKAGLTPPRGVTRARLMELARKLTGRHDLRPRDYDEAIKALEIRRDVLLVYRNTD